MKTCSVEDCEKKHCAKGYCKNHYYELMKDEKGKNYLKNVKYENSLEYFAKHNGMEYLLNEYSDKNDVNPKKISKGSDKICLWNCPDCKSEYDMSVTRRTRNANCPYCVGMRVNHTNCMWTTHPEVAKLLNNPQRGYETTATISKKEEFICEVCGYIEYKYIDNVTKRGYSCSRCSDGISYPEKFMFNVLEQLNIKFEKQRNFEWSNNKKYDFFIPSLNCIIEVHGEQHYNGRFASCGGRNLKEEQENDKLKEKLAKESNINEYIVIDCAESDHKYIKNNIIKSNISILLNINNIDWMKCHEFACSSMVKKVCDLWKEGLNNTIEIGKIVNLDRSTVGMYLKKGKLFGWCDYDPKEVMSKKAKDMVKEHKMKSVVQLSLSGEFIKEWESINEARKNIGLLGNGGISSACKGKRKSAGGFKWIYKEDYINNDEEIKPYDGKSVKKPVIQLSLNDEFIKEWEGLSIAERELNIKAITLVCNGKNNRKSAGGYKWMFKMDYEGYINSK